MSKLDTNTKLDIAEILKDLDQYVPKRRGWVWRKPIEALEQGGHIYHDASEPLDNSIAIPAGVGYFNNLDPQPKESITTEIASGRFEDDIRRMRMAAYHGADHIMVIRTAGQSHYDGLIEGTPQGIGGVPITRKQVRAHRKALDLIEEEVGRPINYHSYVSGVAGPEIAVMFAEEGVNGAHQDPQYNVLYRNINMVRSFVDAAESKKILAWADINQIDGAHNANATAREAWKVMPELMVQHGINSLFSEKSGIKPSNISLSTVPPTAAPVPTLRYDLPYAVALREFFDRYKMRAQMNTKYVTSSSREATVTHVLNMLISRLTSADIQSTITPDEGRNVPWHMYNIEACDTAKQTLVGLDGLMDMIELKPSGALREKAREIKERAVLYLEEMIDMGGYFESVERGMFVDSGEYPERNGDGIARQIEGGIGAGSVFPREQNYLAPVCAHYGYNNTEQYGKTADNVCDLIDGCSFEHREKIQYIDELDPEDNVDLRLAEKAAYRNTDLIMPEVEWLADGVITLDMFLPVGPAIAKAAGLEYAQELGLSEAEVIHVEVMHPAEGTRVQVKGVTNHAVDISKLEIPKEKPVLSDEALWAELEQRPMKVVAGTIGEDEHSVGLREIIDIKHGGIEKWGIQVEYLGTSVPIQKFVDAAIELDADAILISAIISHDDIHYRNMQKVHDYATERGVRDQLLIMAGGTQVTPEYAVDHGMDAGFGRGTKGAHVATALVEGRNQLKR